MNPATHVFQLLPHEIAGEICEYLPFSDIFSLLLTNSATNEVITKKINYFWYKKVRDMREYLHVPTGTNRRGKIILDPDTALGQLFSPQGSFCNNTHHPPSPCRGQCIYKNEEEKSTIVEDCTFSPVRCWLITLMRHSKIYMTNRLKPAVWRTNHVDPLDFQCNNPTHEERKLNTSLDKDLTYIPEFTDYFKQYKRKLFQKSRISPKEIRLLLSAGEEIIEETHRLLDEIHLMGKELFQLYNPDASLF